MSGTPRSILLSKTKPAASPHSPVPTSLSFSTSTSKRSSVPANYHSQHRRSHSHSPSQNQNGRGRISSLSGLQVEAEERLDRACGLESPYLRHYQPLQPVSPHLNDAKIELKCARVRSKEALGLGPAATAPQRTIPRVTHAYLDKYLMSLDSLAARCPDARSARECLDVEGLRRNWDREFKEKERRTVEEDPTRRVFGAPLRKVVTYGSVTTVMGGHEYDLPTVVYACIEELYKTGIYTPHLFRALPSRPRHLHLLSSFDAPPHFGRYTSLAAERTPEVCAVLVSYLESLSRGEGLLGVDGVAWAAWVGCVGADSEYEEEGEGEEGEDGEEGETKEPDKQTDSLRISLYARLLRLLPPSHFSLLVYVLAFFTQVPLSPENGMLEADLARMFGGVVFGCAFREEAEEGGKQAGGRGRQREERKSMGEKMMLWVLMRWSRIVEELMNEEAAVEGSGALDGVREVKTRPSDKERERGRARAKLEATPDPYSHPESGSEAESESTPVPDAGSVCITTTRNRRAGSVSSESSSLSTAEDDDLPSIALRPPRGYENEVGECRYPGLGLADVLACPTKTNAGDTASVYSDVESLSTYSFHVGQDTAESDPTLLTRIAHLEQVVDSQDRALGARDRELERARDRINELEGRLEVEEEEGGMDVVEWYGAMLRKGDEGEGDEGEGDEGEGERLRLSEMLEVAWRERDEARRVIEEIRDRVFVGGVRQ